MSYEHCSGCHIELDKPTIEEVLDEYSEPACWNCGKPRRCVPSHNELLIDLFERVSHLEEQLSLLTNETKE